MSDELGTPAYERDELASAIYRMDSRLHDIGGDTGLMRHEVEDARRDLQTLQEIALAFRDYHLHTHGDRLRDLVWQLRQIKLIVGVVALLLVVKMFA